MCAASQQIDVIPNQGHDGIGAGNLGLMCAHGKLIHFLFYFIFFSQPKRFGADSLDVTPQGMGRMTEQKVFSTSL